MDRNALNNLTLEKAAELLALRREASRRVGGLVKQADIGQALAQYKDNIRNFLSEVWNAAPRHGSPNYTKQVMQESLRNALIGSGIGGIGGGLLGALRGESIIDPAIRGALTGGTLGGAGTAGYRALEYLGSESPSDLKDRKAKEQADATRQQLTEQALQPDAPQQQWLGQAISNAQDGNLGDAINIISSKADPTALGSTAVGGTIGYGLGRVGSRARLARRVQRLKPDELQKIIGDKNYTPPPMATHISDWFRRGGGSTGFEAINRARLTGTNNLGEQQARYQRLKQHVGYGPVGRAMRIGMPLLGAATGYMTGTNEKYRPFIQAPYHGFFGS